MPLQNRREGRLVLIAGKTLQKQPIGGCAAGSALCPEKLLLDAFKLAGHA